MKRLSPAELKAQQAKIANANRDKGTGQFGGNGNIKTPGEKAPTAVKLNMRVDSAFATPALSSVDVAAAQYAKFKADADAKAAQNKAAIEDRATKIELAKGIYDRVVASGYTPKLDPYKAPQFASDYNSKPPLINLINDSDGNAVGVILSKHGASESDKRENAKKHDVLIPYRFEPLIDPNSADKDRTGDWLKTIEEKLNAYLKAFQDGETYEQTNLGNAYGRLRESREEDNKLKVLSGFKIGILLPLTESTTATTLLASGFEMEQDSHKDKVWFRKTVPVNALEE